LIASLRIVPRPRLSPERRAELEVICERAFADFCTWADEDVIRLEPQRLEKRLHPVAQGMVLRHMRFHLGLRVVRPYGDFSEGVTGRLRRSLFTACHQQEVSGLSVQESEWYHKLLLAEMAETG
jgi:hypothetical protein